MTRRSRDRMRIALCLVPMLLLMAGVMGWLTTPIIQRLDDRIYDMRLLSTLSTEQDERVVIVDVDEASLSRVGHWPWSRNRVAELLNELVMRQQARAVGVDMVFAETDNSSGLAQLRNLARDPATPYRGMEGWVESIEAELDFDGQLVKAIRNRPVVLGYYFSSDGHHTRIGELPPPVFTRDAQTNGRPMLRTNPPWTGYGANIAPLTESATSAGFFNALTDPDGLVRTVPLLAEYEGAIYQSLALATFRQAVGGSQLLLRRTSMGSLDALIVADAQGQVLAQLNTNDQAAAFVPFRGAGGPRNAAFRYVSAASVLNGELAPGEFKDKIVLIGSTAPGMQDARATPVAGTFPGVEVHANLLVAMLDSKLPLKPDYARGYGLLLLAVVGSLLIFMPSHIGVMSVVMHVAVPVLAVALDSWLYARHGLVLPLAAALVLWGCLTAINLIVGYLIESRERRQLARVFGTYVPPELVHEMVKRPGAYSMQASARELTVMFCDLQGFTQVSEHMDPTEVQVLLNNLFTHLTEVIYAHGGTVDKYMGDCVMAFWGAPMACEDHADRATRAATAIQERVKTLNAARRIEGRPPIRVCIGVNTGVMAVGDMGSNLRRSYTVIGDAVNLASRIESLTRVYGFNIVAGERTTVLSFEFLWQHVDRVQVKGRAQLEDIYTPISLMTRASADLVAEIDAWNEALAAYLNGNSSQLQAFLMKFGNSSEQKSLYQMFADRLTSPQPDGVVAAPSAAPLLPPPP